MRDFAKAVVVFVLLIFPAHSGQATEIGIIQYNVKAGQGGWTTVNDVVGQQIRLIAREAKKNIADFIAVEQADLEAGMPGPIISDGLEKEGLTGWRTVVSACNKDATQLAFSSSWELVELSAATNPLLNGTSKQRGWIDGGCEANGDGRPYNIAYFRNKTTAFKVLFVIVHMPHCHEHEPARCLDRWSLAAFQEDMRSIVGTDDARGMNLIVVGDMNELGHHGDPLVFERLFSNFGKLKLSPALLSCCYDSNWTFSFDRILTNSSTAPVATILMDGGYPLNAQFPKNEEHKAIFGTVRF
jgi:hypothetical protein